LPSGLKLNSILEDEKAYNNMISFYYISIKFKILDFERSMTSVTDPASDFSATAYK